MIGEPRKRNSRCRNRICACTGACFVDDGTGDFAVKVKKRDLMRSGVEPRIALERIQSRMLGWDDREDEVKRLRDFIESLTLAGGQFPYLDGTTVVSVARKVLNGEETKQ